MVFSSINFQFSNCCSLIWMFTSKGCDKRMDRIHERFLRLMLKDYESNDMVSTLKGKTIHWRCINVLLTEIHEYLNSLAPELMSEVFYLHQNRYTLRSLNVFAKYYSLNKFTLNSTVYWANQIWQTLPSEVKDCLSLQFFMNKIKILHRDRCHRQICSRFLVNVGYF